MKTYKLKTLPHFFNALSDGVKNFEIRKNDRDFHVGDTLHLEEWTPDAHYTGRMLVRIVIYITAFAQQPGWIVMGLARD